MGKRAIDLKSSSCIVGRSESVNRFFRDIGKYDTLTPEEEYELFRKMRYGATPKERKRAKEQIVNCNQRFVAGCAKKYATESTWPDYINEGNIGLLEAIDSFDETKGFKFVTHAVHYIKRAIVNYRQQTTGLVRQSNLAKTQLQKSKAINKFMQKYERTPSEKELMVFMNKTAKRKIKDAHDLTDMKYTYIDAEGMENDSVNFSDSGIGDYYKASSNANGYVESADMEHNKELLKSLIRHLPERDQRVIRMRYGISDGEDVVKTELSTGEIAKILGLTQERVRQIEVESVKKLHELCLAKKIVN